MRLASFFHLLEYTMILRPLPRKSTDGLWGGYTHIQFYVWAHKVFWGRGSTFSSDFPKTSRTSIGYKHETPKSDPYLCPSYLVQWWVRDRFPRKVCWITEQVFETTNCQAAWWSDSLDGWHALIWNLGITWMDSFLVSRKEAVHEWYKEEGAATDPAGCPRWPVVAFPAVGTEATFPRKHTEEMFSSPRQLLSARKSPETAFPGRYSGIELALPSTWTSLSRSLKFSPQTSRAEPRPARKHTRLTIQWHSVTFSDFSKGVFLCK